MVALRFRSWAAISFLLSACIIAAVQGAPTGPFTQSFHPTLRSHVRPRRLSEDNCILSLEPHIRKVSLMFLVRGDIPHEAVWTEWIGDLAGMVPSSVVCNKDASECYRGMRQARLPAKSVYDEQSYFSIVVHTKPDYPGYTNGSIFDGRIVNERIETEWAGHSLVKATVILMRAALEDPLAQRFQLLCEASIPVRAPLFAHQQLMSLNMSRVGEPNRSFKEIDKGSYYFPLAMHEEWRDLKRHAKFHRQFVTLIREHAQWVVDDNFVIGIFERHCYQSSERHQFFCVSDEQYIGTLLSWKLGDQLIYSYSDDMAMAMVRNSMGLSAEELDVELLIQIRGSTSNISRLYQFEDHKGECHAMERPTSKHVLFEGDYSHECKLNLKMQDPPPYDRNHFFPRCFLFARKFNAPTAPAAKRILEDLFII